MLKPNNDQNTFHNFVISFIIYFHSTINALILQLPKLKPRLFTLPVSLSVIQLPKEVRAHWKSVAASQGGGGAS